MLGISTSMPSAKVWLGHYVVTSNGARKDGTYNVTFQVPKRLAPEGWPPVIALPRTGDRRGDLSDPREVARIRADADELYGLLKQGRVPGGREPELPVVPGTLPHVIQIWRKSWDELAPRTITFYEEVIPVLMAWSSAAAQGGQHKPLRTVTPQAVRDLLSVYNDRRSRRKAIKQTLHRVFAIALQEGLVTKNPMVGLTTGKTSRQPKKRAVVVWSREALAAYITAATEIGWPSGGRLLQAMWETAADRSDVVTWTRNKHYRPATPDRPARVVFERGKTSERGDIPISRALAAGWETAGSLYLVTDPKGVPFAGPEHDNRLDSWMKRVKARAIKNGAPKLLFDHLRHTAATEASRLGFQPLQVSRLTTHATPDQTEKVYIQSDEQDLLNIQKARGIIE